MPETWEGLTGFCRGLGLKDPEIWSELCISGREEYGLFWRERPKFLCRWAEWRPGSGYDASPEDASLSSRNLGVLIVSNGSTYLTYKPTKVCLL